MSDFVEKLRLAEQTAEDLYFARVDRELIEALHRKRAAGDTTGKRPVAANRQRPGDD